MEIDAGDICAIYFHLSILGIVGIIETLQILLYDKEFVLIFLTHESFLQTR